MQELTNTKSDEAVLTQTSKGEPGMGKTNKLEAVDNSTQLQTVNKDNLPASPHFIKLEKNLISFGFFTASSKRIKTEKSKTIVITRKSKGKEIKGEATIVPSALYGLPVTADQDKFI